MRDLHDGRQDGLEPLESLDVRRPGGLAELLDAMSKTAFGGRRLGEAFGVLRAMAEDPQCHIVVTVSGAMTVAKMGRVLCDVIDAGLAHMIVCTGAVMAHGLSEAIGCIHYKHEPRLSDEQLFAWGYNRVYDTLEMEANLNQTESTVRRVFSRLDWSRPVASWEINREIGRALFEEGQMPSVLGCAYDRGVPVYVPALTDSELGLDISTFFLAEARESQQTDDLDTLFGTTPPLNPFLDLHDFARRILAAPRLGIFTVGGGVPRNWAQQIGPFVDIINARLKLNVPVPKYQYGVRICPEPVHWGGLSGCTYSEGVSWGKFVSPAEGGRFAEVYCDATIALPLLVRAVLETRQQKPVKGP